MRKSLAYHKSVSYIKSKEFKLEDNYITQMTPRKAFLESQGSNSNCPLKLSMSKSAHQIMNKTAQKPGFPHLTSEKVMQSEAATRSLDKR